MDKNEYLLKIMVLGRPIKLKEKLIYKMTSDDISKGRYLGGVEIPVFKIQVDDNNVKLILVVTKEEIPPEYRSKSGTIYRGSSACVIFFDKEHKETFATVEEQIKDFRKYIPNMKVALHIAGVKKYIEDVTTEEAQALADKYQIKYYEVSLDDSESIENVFRSLTRKALEYRGR